MSKSSIFRPSKLTDVADQMWKKSADSRKDETQLAGGETKPFSLGLLEGLGNKKLPDVSIPSTSGEEKAAVTDSFVFGQNIEERVVISTDKPISEENSKENKSEKSELESKPAVDTSLSPTSAAKAEPVRILTGEEDENSVFHAVCKLFQLDKEKNKWSERGRGTLKINDKGSLYDRTAEKFESRIVMRTQGSLRVILNSKIWADMKVTRVSDKSLSLSAFDYETGGIVAYLVTASVKDSESMEVCIQDRIGQLKSLEAKSLKTAEVPVSPEKRKVDSSDEEIEGKRRKISPAEETDASTKE